jgi:hypothetical protein
MLPACAAVSAVWYCNWIAPPPVNGVADLCISK